MSKDKQREKKTASALENKVRGESVDKHQTLENANLYLNEGEISQQNNNL
ncbi:hypothetical protein QUF49_13495 [Fictibacillus sp. b24]|nr:hypothetical protein [Fictibacillus sp. b24]MDM5317015.1 hypothetical protein [Fictibacillus sp. b24]